MKDEKVGRNQGSYTVNAYGTCFYRSGVYLFWRAWDMRVRAGTKNYDKLFKASYFRFLFIHGENISILIFLLNVSKVIFEVSYFYLWLEILQTNRVISGCFRVSYFTVFFNYSNNFHLDFTRIFATTVVTQLGLLTPPLERYFDPLSEIE